MIDLPPPQTVPIDDSKAQIEAGGVRRLMPYKAEASTFDGALAQLCRQFYAENNMELDRFVDIYHAEFNDGTKVKLTFKRPPKVKKAQVSKKAAV